jgi:hypothetical protein
MPAALAALTGGSLNSEALLLDLLQFRIAELRGLEVDFRY